MSHFLGHHDLRLSQCIAHHPSLSLTGGLSVCGTTLSFEGFKLVGGVSFGVYMREFTAWWDPRGIQTDGRVPVRGGDRSRRGGVGVLLPLPAPHSATWGASGRRSAGLAAQIGRGRWWTGDSAPKASVVSPSAYEGRRGRQVVGDRQWTRSMGRPLRLPNVTNVRE